MKDTPPEVQKRYDELLRRLSPEDRLAMCCRMFSATKVLVRAGVIQSGAQTDEEIRKQVFLCFYGNEFSESEREKIVSYLQTGGKYRRE